MNPYQAPPHVSSGVWGMDEILNGGFLKSRSYLLLGGPGTGKTTLGMHFLAAGGNNGERCLFINLGEPEEQIRSNAASVGITIEGVKFLDLRPTPDFFRDTQTYSVFPPSDVEREPITAQIVSAIEELRPERVFLDTVTHFRYLAPNNFQFRRQMHSFLRFLMENGATLVLTAEETEHQTDDDLQFMCDSVICLDRDSTSGERFVAILKYRGSKYREGRHAMRLTEGGMQVYPRLQSTVSDREFVPEILSSGIPELDDLMHGGVERGLVTLITGPTGVGKTSLGMQFMKAAASRQERSVIYTFEEWRESLIKRSEAVNIPVSDMLGNGMLSVVQVDPLQYVPDEFALLVRRDVEDYETRIVMIDSTAGYRLSLRGHDLISHLHALSKYLQSMGVAVLLINEVNDITGEFRPTELDISYMADNLIFLRYIELSGGIHRVIGVLKKRVSSFENTMRELQIDRHGLHVGKPLTDMRDILTGKPIRISDNTVDK